mmetsp:Transcript_100605/g.260459  ORF Transcript_100605/g.260459 Transcript_100605/m.260459 type:complete len:361 (+) Transcript_100605:588-1670(+)
MLVVVGAQVFQDLHDSQRRTRQHALPSLLRVYVPLVPVQRSAVEMAKAFDVLGQGDGVAQRVVVRAALEAGTIAEDRVIDHDPGDRPIEVRLLKRLLDALSLDLPHLELHAIALEGLPGPFSVLPRCRVTVREDADELGSPILRELCHCLLDVQDEGLRDLIGGHAAGARGELMRCRRRSGGLGQPLDGAAADVTAAMEALRLVAWGIEANLVHGLVCAAERLREVRGKACDSEHAAAAGDETSLHGLRARVVNLDAVDRSGLWEAMNRQAFRVRAWIALRGADDGGGCPMLPAHLGHTRLQVALGATEGHVEEVRVEEGEQDLGLGIAEAAIILQQHRPALREHEAAVEYADVFPTLHG